MSIPESIVREIERAIEAAEFPGGMSVRDGKARVDSSHLRRLLAELAALRAELAVLRNNQLGPVPEGPLKALGAWVADHTDDDTWPNAERYLNAALAEMEALRERNARLVGVGDE